MGITPYEVRGKCTVRIQQSGRVECYFSIIQLSSGLMASFIFYRVFHTQLLASLIFNSHLTSGRGLCIQSDSHKI